MILNIKKIKNICFVIKNNAQTKVCRVARKTWIDPSVFLHPELAH